MNPQIIMVATILMTSDVDDYDYSVTRAPVMILTMTNDNADDDDQ